MTAKLRVEGAPPRIHVARREDAIGDGAAHEHPARRPDVDALVMARKRQRDLHDPVAPRYGRRRLGGDDRSLRHVRIDPASNDDARVRARPANVVSDRPRQRDDEQEQRDRGERTHASGKSPERRDEREHVTREVRVQRQERHVIADDEGAEHEVAAARPPRERQHEAEQRDQQDRTEAAPQLPCEGNARPVVVLEAEPALAVLARDPPQRRPRVARVEEHERRRGEERERGERSRHRQAPPPVPADHDQRHERQRAGVLRRRREPDRDTGPFEPSRNEQRERDGDERRQRHVRHRGMREGDVRRLDRRHCRRDRTRDDAVRGRPEPPRRGDAAERERDDHDPARKVRGCGLPRLERRDGVRDERRPVEEVRIQTAAVAHPPCARDDVLLVGVEQRAVRQAVLDPDEPQRSRARDDRSESRARASPVRRVRPPEARHRRARRRSAPARSPRRRRAVPARRSRLA